MKEQFDGVVDRLLDGGFTLEESVGMLERRLIEGALQRAAGNQSVASKRLGIHRNTIQRKMSEYELAGRRVRRKPVARVTRKTSGKRNVS